VDGGNILKIDLFAVHSMKLMKRITRKLYLARRPKVHA
jgi:hypothetical protein